MLRPVTYLAALTLGTAATAPPNLLAQDAIVGRWEGAVDISGQHLSIAVMFQRQDGALVAKLDIQGQMGVLLQNTSYEESRVHFELDVPQAKATFDGEHRGDEITGTFRQEDGEGTFSLTRVEEMALDGPIMRLMEENHIPGLAATAIRDGEVVWVGTYGYANVAAQTPVTPQTLFMLASVSKTLTATALMQLHAQGRFELDDDVSNHLPFTVRNPAFPSVPITFGLLLRHRSSIRDNMAFYGPYWSTPLGDPDTRLGEYLEHYLAEGGNDYDAEENFFQEQPGSEFHYCNTCYALLGYLAERISGLPYEDYSEQALLGPLEMNETAWFYADVDSNRVAMPYRYDDSTGYEPYGVVGYPDWPAGQLRSSITELSRFLAAYSQYGRLDGRSVFDSTIVELMAPRHQALGFYTWFASSLTSTGSVLYSHGGGDLGARTQIGFDPATRVAFAVLTNGEASIDEIVALIYKAIPTLGWTKTVTQ